MRVRSKSHSANALVSNLCRRRNIFVPRHDCPGRFRNRRRYPLLSTSHHVSTHIANRRMRVRVVLVPWIALYIAKIAAAEPLEKLADDFWTWRAKYAPFTGDDVNRLGRPGGMRDWSRASVEQRRKDLAGFEARWKKMNPTQSPIPEQVDYRLIGSALSRVH